MSQEQDAKDATGRSTERNDPSLVAAITDIGADEAIRQAQDGQPEVRYRASRQGGREYAKKKATTKKKK